MAKFSLAFGIHSHQPVGNFKAVFEDAHCQAYQPFLKLMEAHPDLRFALHQSGILWDWQKGTHPDYFVQVGRLVDRGQLELMTGGFYEPILTSIPRRDGLGQIELLNRFLADHFGASPRGLWLTERIWEPHLPELLAAAGITYLPCDDTHFIYAGFEPEQLTGPFVTEHEGHALILLPIQKRLRYLIPFGTVEEVIDELKRQADLNPEGLATYADDGEKFGTWPGTHKHCYTDRWLETFLEALEANSDWLQMVPLHEAAAMKPVGRAYLPSASYEEMLHWSLPTPAFMAFEDFEHWLKERGGLAPFGRFVRGGHWRGFLTKYEESNLMHKKMLHVSELLETAERQQAGSETERQQARELLYASQCNCPYWHGVFGGLYLPHIRHEVFAKMIAAQHQTRQLLGGGSPTLTQVDYDLDGAPEIVFESAQLGAVVKPDRGGTLIELTLNQPPLNLTDTLTRRREGYHRKLEQAVAPGEAKEGTSIHDLVVAKEDGLEQHLVEDWYLKRCLIDHFLPDELTLAGFNRAHYGELGDFVAGEYLCQITESANRVQLHRDGVVRIADSEIPVTLCKELIFEAETGTLQVQYDLSTSHPGGIDINFGIENNFNFQAGHAEDRYAVIDGCRPDESFLDSSGTHPQAQQVTLIDEYRAAAVSVSADRPCDIWRMPIFTVSLSEGGFEKVYQGTTVLHRCQLHLTSQPTRLTLSLKMGSLAEFDRRETAQKAGRA